MLERAFRGSAAGARHLSELYANAGQLRESWHREYSNRSRDRKGALGLWATPATLPYGRGSDWGFLLVDFYVVHPIGLWPVVPCQRDRRIGFCRLLQVGWAAREAG